MAALTTLSFYSMTVQAQDIPAFKDPIIQTTGQGSVSSKPDMAEISIGVTTEDASPNEALKRNNDATGQLIAALTGAGIAKADLQTANFSVSPQYRNVAEGQKQPPVYLVTNTVKVRVRALQTLGDILSRAVGTGANQINSLSFAIGDPAKGLQEARAAAFDDAKVKAETYAKAAGKILGPVLLMVEPQSGAPETLYRARSFGRAAAASVPIEAGEENLSAQLTVVWKLIEP
jgi:hypothetical protein